MYPQNLLGFMQNPQVIEQLAMLQAAHNNAVSAQVNTDQAKMQALETQNVALIGQLQNMNMTMGALGAEMSALKEQHAATETAKQQFESQNVALIGQLKEMNRAMQELIAEREVIKINIDAIRELQEQHAKELCDKDQEIQTLKTQLAASQEESTRKNMKLLEQHAKEMNNKNLVIGDLETHLSAADQRTDDKLKMLQEQHDKQIKGKDLELQTLQDKLAASHEQHAKELTDKDLVIKELETRLPAAEVQTVDKVMELTNENKRLSLGIQKLQKEKVFAEKRLQSLGVMLQEKLRQKEDVQKKKEEVVSKPTTQRHTELHTELGKLYMELQEAKKPQEALMAQLAAKDKEIEFLMEQHKSKLAAKDSEIQNLKEMIQGGEEMNMNVIAKDAEVEAVMTGGQSE
ncbi:hypothetical protein GCK72_015901 [Caenorhabditis remanei]|uniref:Uncharacterized protein n=1 Tax=Caenorhabditis remanei TaxID=31234 RepID=A0A6A5GXW4_CAERE|nr:hypothetical protein GCK72_015901 [Caenorhabditis remanei]KAF1759434.1 hypothetical protein GCK72_015901 [Caenorhabditis remanei]